MASRSRKIEASSIAQTAATPPGRKLELPALAEISRWARLAIGSFRSRCWPKASGCFARSDRHELPAVLIRAEFSRQFMEQYFQRGIEHDDVVDDVILGTKIDGQSHLSGAIRLVLVPSDNDVRFDLIFTGVCRSRTQGVNDVVVLQNTAETQLSGPQAVSSGTRRG